MDGKDITKKLRMSGNSVKGIAHKLGVKPPTVSQVIHKVRPNPRIRSAIAKAIGEEVSELFPERK